MNVTLPVTANGREVATSYKVYWGTDAAATNGGSKTFPALGKDNNFFIIDGLASGNTNFKISALVGATESAASPVATANIGAAYPGTNTLSGTVSFPGSAPTGSAMVVIAYSQTSGVYFTRIANPVSPQSYTISGIPNGSYRHIALVDFNQNGKVNPGDPNNTDGDPPVVSLTGAGATANLALPTGNATAVAQTDFWTDGTSSNYSINLGTLDNLKRIVNVILYSGKNVAVPFDMEYKSGNTTSLSLNTATAPTVGDAYKYRVTYSDGTTADLMASVTGAFTSANVATSPAASTSLTPTLSWAAPTSAPTSYGYALRVTNQTYTTTFWNYPQNDLLPSGTTSGTTSVVYNTDGNATALSNATTYLLNVYVRDLVTGNGGTRAISFTTP